MEAGCFDAAGKLGGDVGFAAKLVSEVKGTAVGFGRGAFRIEPLRMAVVSGVVDDGVHRGDRTGKQTGEVTSGHGCETEDGAGVMARNSSREIGEQRSEVGVRKETKKP